MPTVEQMKMIIVAEESDGLAAAALLGLLAAGAGVAAMVMVTIVARRARTVDCILLVECRRIVADEWQCEAGVIYWLPGCGAACSIKPSNSQKFSKIRYN